MAKYRIVSLDTSSRKSGFAVFEGGKLMTSGVIVPPKDMDRESRINLMCKKIFDILDKYKPGSIIIEKMVVANNPPVQRILSEIIGAVRGYSIINDKEFVEYSPVVWRKEVLRKNEKMPRNRKAAKLWSVKKVKALFKKDPRHTLVDVTCNFIRNCSGIQSQICGRRSVFIRSEHCNRIPELYIVVCTEVDHALIHADSSDNRE